MRATKAEDAIWLGLPLIMGVGMVLMLATRSAGWWMPFAGVECTLVTGAITHYRGGRIGLEGMRQGVGRGNALTMAAVALAMFASVPDPRLGAPLLPAAVAFVAGLVTLGWTLSVSGLVRRP